MKLIIINGPCGVGKSVIAEKLHDSMPLSYLLDIDAHSRNISHYREYREERWEMSLAVARAIMNACLSLGRDIIVDKMTYDPSILDSYYSLAKKYNADIHEFILWADKDTVLRRAEKRGYKPGGLLTREKTKRFWEEFKILTAKRKKAMIIDTNKLTENQIVRFVRKHMKK